MNELDITNKIPAPKQQMKSILPNLFLPTINSPENVVAIEEMINNKEYERARHYESSYIFQAIKNIQEKNPDMTLSDTLTMINDLGIGD